MVAVPAFLMLGAVVAMSVTSLSLVLLGGRESPFLLTGLMQVGGLAGYAALLVSRYRGLMWEGRLWECFLVEMGRPWRWVWAVLGVLSGLDLAVFMLATRWVDVSVAAVLFASWPLAAVPVLGLLMRGRYRRVGPGLVAGLAVGWCGVALVVLGQSGAGAGAPWGPGLALALPGVALGILSGVVTGLAVFVFRLGSGLASSVLDAGLVGSRGRVDLEVLGMGVGLVATGVASVGVNVALGLSLGETLGGRGILGGLGAGLVVYFVGSLLWRLANLVTLDLGVNLLGCLGCLVEIFWLWAYVQLGLPGGGGLLLVERGDLLLLGALGVVVAGVSLGFPGVVRSVPGLGLLCLWGFGTAVHLRALGAWELGPAWALATGVLVGAVALHVAQVLLRRVLFPGGLPWLSVVWFGLATGSLLGLSGPAGGGGGVALWTLVDLGSAVIVGGTGCLVAWARGWPGVRGLGGGAGWAAAVSVVVCLWWLRWPW